MRFQPKNEDELNPLIPAGLYDAEVVKAEEKTSKAGNEMIALTLRVYLASGDTILLNDWLMEAVQAKLLAFCNAAGLRTVYDSGELQANHCEGRSVKVNIVVKNNGEYGDQNSIKTYVMDRPAPTEPSRPPVEPSRRRAPGKPADFPDPNAVGAGVESDDPF